MTSYVALLDGGRREARVSVTAAGPGLYEVRIGDEVHLYDAARVDPATWSLLEGGAGGGASHAAVLEEKGGQATVRVRGGAVTLELLDERKLRLRRPAPGRGWAGRQVVTAPLPGRIVKVLVKRGDAVRAGQPLVVVDAMRMENEMRSPRDGTVTEVLVAEGQVVEGRAELCAVE